MLVYLFDLQPGSKHLRCRCYLHASGDTLAACRLILFKRWSVARLQFHKTPHDSDVYAKIVGSVSYYRFSFILCAHNTTACWTVNKRERERESVCETLRHVCAAKPAHICICRSMQTIFRLKLTVKWNFQIYCSDMNLCNFFFLLLLQILFHNN